MVWGSTTGCAFVTGGSGDIGAAIVRRLAQDGLSIAIGYSTQQERATHVSEALSRDGARAIAVRVDVRDSASIDRAFDEIEDELGNVAVLVNNAGMSANGLLYGMEEADWESVIDTNLNSAFRTSRRALKPMIRARHGRIINISSVLSSRSISGTSNYTASKAGLVGLTKTLAIEVAARGITVNAVCPGLVATAMTDELGHFEQSVARAVPTGRPAKLHEIADCVAFLASDSAAYITGQSIAVDGGLSAQAFSLH